MQVFSNNEQLSKTAFKDFISETIKETKRLKEKSLDYSVVERTKDYLENLSNAFLILSKNAEKKKIASSGVEWFLDNYHVVLEAVELIRDDLPQDYFNKLPSIDPGMKIPRVYFLARKIVSFYEIEVTPNDLHDFLDAYQEDISLQMSELWALPLMLRLTLVELLAGTVYDLIEDQKALNQVDNVKFSHIESGEVVARALRTLILFDHIDWKSFIESHSEVEKILSKDPVNVYRRMDFDTRDQYRKKIEGFAEKSKLSEKEIAQVSIDLARNPQNKGQKAEHVGYYLIGDGVEQLKKKIKYQSDFSAKIESFFFKHNTAFYLGSIAFITILVMAGLILISSIFTDAVLLQMIIFAVSFVPASSVAVNLVNSILTTILPPRILPKMDFRKKIPRKYRTMVVIPALLTNHEEIKFLLGQLELHYLANKLTNIGFALLTDFSDSPEERMPEDKALLNEAINGINQLNDRYQGVNGFRPFYLFHRRRQWNEQENAWMGWERKRGKLADFNRFLLEGYDHSFETKIGDMDFLKNVVFVITVDADTVLPRDSAQDLIATLAHPLNRPEFDEKTGKVTSGYTILQPRTEVKPTTVNRSIFTRIFAGVLGLDLYTRAVSDIYQDLFGEGIYVGKGIYDVKAFQKSLEGKVPENALLSHDLFEGIQGRAALVSDVVFFEEYPPNYASYAQRKHRWVRGDWQLLPWLFPKVPLEKGGSGSNPFSLIDLWKIFDNLRRSLLSTMIMLLLVFGWVFFGDRGWIWTIIVLIISAFPLLNNIVTALSSRFIIGKTSNLVSNIIKAFYRWVLWLVFLPYDSIIMIDAVLTTLVRIYISHKRLLQWQTSAHTIRLFGREHKVGIIWRRMLGAPLISIAMGLLLYLANRSCLWVCLPILSLWLISPQIAYWISIEQKQKIKEHLGNEDILKLRMIARKTWLYFERFIGPEDHWLPPDHFQEDPKGTVAHRTSPTNIGLMMLSTCSAYDLGYIALLDFIYRIEYTLETIDELEKYRGHLLNWYDTVTQETLSPRYVSTVDSGNYATSLIGLSQALGELPEQNIGYTKLFQGVIDSLEVFCSVIYSIEQPSVQDIATELHEFCREIQNEIKAQSTEDSGQLALLTTLEEGISEPLTRLLQEILNKEASIDAALLRDLRLWSSVVFQHIINMRSQLNLLAPWMETWQKRPDFLNEFENAYWNEIFTPWIKDKALQIRLSDIPGLCDKTIKDLNRLKPIEENDIFSMMNHSQKVRLRKWVNTIIEDFQESKTNVNGILNLLDELKKKIEFYLERMEFDFLFDDNREVFYLGYQVGSGQLDKNHYDLLASEARTASLYAISQNQVPRSHWLHMSRPFTTVDGIPTLLSWNGSMFEYLMPNLYTKIYPETLLEQTSKGVVKSQINYAREKKVPWGISESGYYRFDRSENYQYKGFGVPELGRKRGLENDLVIAPYASMMAININPLAVLDNIEDLEDAGAMGHFGFYESIDYTTSRLPVDQEKAVVKTYMAHHQGMIMVALANFLGPKSITERVHKDPRIKSTELLLQEQIPQIKPIEKQKEIQVSSRTKEAAGALVVPWQVSTMRPYKSINVISNGNLRMFMTESGSGYLEWKDNALTRWRKDPSIDRWGVWFFIQDLDRNKVWSITRRPIDVEAQEYRVIYGPHMIEIRRVTEDIRAILRTTITPKDDICVQKISITNQSNERRNLRILSYGEVVLAPQATDQQHPAFNKMFIESSFYPEQNMLHFQRRKRSADEDPLGMSHLLISDDDGEGEFETDRQKFIGRGHEIANAVALNTNSKLNGTVGITLDPIFSIGKRLKFEPNDSVDLNYLTLAVENVEQALTHVDNYKNTVKITNAFDSAESHSERILRALELNSEKLSKYQSLLSYIIFPIPRLRAETSTLIKNTLSQSGLWSFGISGDYPILLVLIDQQEELEALQETILAHVYWRKLGLMIDLVILNTKDTGYEHELNEKIHQVINRMDAQEWVNARGGIFVLTASNMEKSSIILLKSAAEVLLDLKAADLEAHLKKAEEIEPSLPALIPTEQDELYTVDERIPRPEDLVLDNGIGGFTKDGKEYKIFIEDYPKSTKEIGQQTPAPWINVIANQELGFLVSETGSGYTWSINSGENRLTPWMNDPVTDPSGESLYLRDEITGSVWSPTPYPSGKGTDYLVIHGQGYTIFRSINHGFEQEIKMFVDPVKPIKYIQLKLKNKTTKLRRLTATYYTEWVLSSNRENSEKFLVPTYEDNNGILMARNTYSAEFSEYIAFLTTDHPVHGLTTDRREFLGMPGNRSHPVGLKRIGLSSKVQSGVDPCAALQSHLNFEPGEEKTITFMVGQEKSAEKVINLVQKSNKPENIEDAFEAGKKKWDSLLNTLQVETPDQELDIVLNRWLLYQAMSCRIWGRSAFYQSSGAYGFRDQLQDVTSILAVTPQESREHILRAAEHQFKAGDVLHWWHPPSGRGVRTRITDDLLWLVYVTAEYIYKTGDADILKEEIPFRIGEPLQEGEEERYGHYETSEEKYSLFEHCRRALIQGDTRGPHGLPLIGSGDWNDGMNRVGIGGKGESVWLGWFLYENHKRFADLCEIMKEQELASKHRERAEEIRQTINQVAWDDNWYLRAFYDDGTPLGSHRNEECQIDSLPQSWSILTNGAPKERKFKAIQSVDENLVQRDDRLIQLFTPPFDETEKDPGYIKGYPPGIRENGGQYTHAAIWAVWALTDLGMGDQAYEQLRLLNPVTHSLNLDDANRYVVEPYVVAADIYSRPPYVGRGGWTWYTGSSGWLYRLGTEAILGFRILGNKFTIDPCIPHSWDGFKMIYKKNGSVFNIDVKNPDHVEKGVVEIRLDGEELDDHQIPLLNDASTHQVTVILG